MAFPLITSGVFAVTFLKKAKVKFPLFMDHLRIPYGRRLLIEIEMEQDVDCELCVSSIDASRNELFTCIKLAKLGIETECKKCYPIADNYRLEIIPPD